MTKAYSKRKLGLTSSHRKLMLRNLTESLFLSEKLILPISRAKELQRFSERIISVAKRNRANSYRTINKDIHNKDVIKKIFEVLVPRFVDRKGGYVQVFRFVKRRTGDGTEMSLIKLIQ